jgi:bacillithiol biosynthesis cysteine-adding enzyme BshC
MTISLREVPGVSRLYLDYLENFERVAEFYNGDFHQNEIFFERAKEVQARSLPLHQLLPILKEQNQRFGGGQPTRENLAHLQNGAAAIVTGQQTGLFGGPLFTIYKALTAIKLAAHLNEKGSARFVPIFWLASDDHDFREANHIHILDKTNQPLEIHYPGHPSDGRVPIYAIKISERISESIAQLDDATHPSDFKPEILQALREAYQPEAAFSDAFGKWLMQLCQSFGLMLIDASDARIKSLGKKVFEKEIAEHSPSTRAALQATERLLQKNYHAQVQFHDDVLNLFFVESERQAIEVNEGSFFVKGTNRSFELNQLLSWLEEKPQAFSPNVLLRPVYQDALLPTAAYVAGPAELAYYAQMKGIYEHFGTPMPIIFPRKSLTLLESKIQKVLANYRLTVSDFWKETDGLINAVAKEQVPENLEKRIQNAQQCIAKNLQALDDVVSEFDPTLKDAVQNVKGKILHQVEQLESKIVQSYKKRNAVIVQQINKAGNHLFPKRQLQERALNATPFLFKYGWQFVQKIYDELDIWNFDHQIIEM